MQRWRHFTDEEATGLIPDLMYKLDRARDLFGEPIVITSGLRTVEQNDCADGVKDSAHVTGMAADLRCSDPEAQKRLAWALGASGLFRIGVYDKHIHCDVDRSKPLPAYWTGISH